MKVKSVEYRKLVSDSQYNNEAYGVVVDLEDGDTVESAIAYARDTVNEWHGEAEEQKSFQEELNRQEWRLSELYQEVQRREARCKRLVEFEAKIRERLGVPAVEDELPF